MSGKHKESGYTWWPADFAMDEHVRVMTYEEQGVYRALLDLSWLHGSIPDDVVGISRILHIPPRRMRKLWPAIAPCWRPGEPGRLVNGRLERERADLLAFREARSEAGRKGNAKRWHSDGSRNAQGSPPSPTPSPSPSERQKQLPAFRSRESELPGSNRSRTTNQGIAHIAELLPE